MPSMLPSKVVGRKRLLCGLTLVFSVIVLASPKNVTLTASMPVPPPPQPSGIVDFDFDGDGKADIGRWHTSNTEFKIKNSNGGSYSTYTIGSSTAKSAPADFDGDGKTD